MNRRTFIQRCFAGVVGAIAVFVPGNEKPPAVVANGTDKVYKWRRWGKVESPAKPLSEGEIPKNPYEIGWSMSYKARILNDGHVHKITGPPEEMERFYKALKKEFPDDCE